MNQRLIHTTLSTEHQDHVQKVKLISTAFEVIDENGIQEKERDYGGKQMGKQFPKLEHFQPKTERTDTRIYSPFIIFSMGNEVLDFKELT